jgi:NAD(P)H-dependent flavin oxidoreductase YrpB (nitropropane dioxygenase family)
MRTGGNLVSADVTNSQLPTAHRPPPTIQTPFTARFGVRYPIVQGGLAHLAFAGLAAAVSNAGGLGQITAASFQTPEDLRAEIAAARALTDRPFAVNFAIGHRPLDDLLEATLDAGVAAISITGGNPEPFLRRIAGTGVRALVLTAGVRQAQKAESLGADAVIAVGQEGGGHLGRDDLGTIVLVPRVVDAVGIPVLASGGIGDARGLAAALALGAAGIEMGTRFVATRECIAHAAYKEALIRASERDTVVIERSIGRPGRTLDTLGARRVLDAEAQASGIEELLPLIDGRVNRRGAQEGDLAEGFVWAGQVIGLIDDVPPVADLIARMVAGAAEIAGRMGRMLGETT